MNLIRLADYFDMCVDYAFEISNSEDDKNIYDYVYDYSITDRIADLESEFAEYKKNHLA